MSRIYEEIEIYAGIAERTGNSLHRTVCRTRPMCSSLRQLGSTTRRLGDGLYYLAAGVWPAETRTLDLNQPWIPL